MTKHYLFIWIAALIFSGDLYAIEITHVYHVPESINTKNKESVNISFTLSEKADVMVNIFDEREILINSIEENGLSPGDHKVTWKGKDRTGKWVPPEAYHYTIVAKGINGEIVEHDITDSTGSIDYRVDDIAWHEVTNQFTYSLSEPSRVLIRVGITSGPLLKNVVNWQARSRGNQTEYWDGKDASKIIELSKHPKMDIQIQAYTLSKNTIVVSGSATDNQYIKVEPPLVKRVPKKRDRKKMLEISQQDPESRGDYPAKLDFVQKLSKNADGIDIVTDRAAMMVSVDDRYRNIVLTRRMEPVIFIDGQFAFENEVGFVPMTWMLDATQYNEGVHYISVNLRGYEGNFGMATRKFYVKHSKKN